MSTPANAASLAAHLKAGGPALFPTDTVVALAAIPAAAEQLWGLKQRPSSKAVILMGAEAGDLWPCLGVPVLPEWRDLAAAHWPGALTLVLPAQGPVVEQLNPGGNSLGLRVPACPAALELLRLSGPLATTSANRSGEPACGTDSEAEAAFQAVPLLGPRPWPRGSGQASTVLAWRPEGRWQLLREGGVRPAGLPMESA